MDHSPMAWFNRIMIGILVIAVIGGGAFMFMRSMGEGKAKINQMIPGGHVAGRFHCWLTLEFKEIPEGIDPKNVEVVFSSIALEEDVVTFDWNYIADHALIKNPKGTGRLTTEVIQAAKNPAVNYPFDVNFYLEPRMEIETSSIPKLKAQLYWDGVLQDSSTRSLGFLYQRK